MFLINLNGTTRSINVKQKYVCMKEERNQNKNTPKALVICTFIDNKTTDSDLVISRQHGAILESLLTPCVRLMVLQFSIYSKARRKTCFSIQIEEGNNIIIHSCKSNNIYIFKMPQPNTDHKSFHRVLKALIIWSQMDSFSF